MLVASQQRNRAQNYARSPSGNPKGPSLADNYMQLSHFHQVRPFRGGTPSLTVVRPPRRAGSLWDTSKGA
ncbi:hypothetical protein HPB47_012966 [Ixodes persulcatus]|uniref:Uncharacterized protein n=1 Tax=Ixodes persulcatus TaxID=34615 RepID=A0AC60NS17_IXOPE|nr:hypothetical protein HPB47_012966 [Ixodes persulcatus]